MLSNKLKAAGDAATQAQAAFLLMSEALSEASVQAAEQERVIEDLNSRIEIQDNFRRELYELLAKYENY